MVDLIKFPTECHCIEKDLEITVPGQCINIQNGIGEHTMNDTGMKLIRISGLQVMST